MKAFLKKALPSVLQMAAVFLFLGGALCFAVLLASLSAWPPYVQRALWVFSALALIAATVAAGGFLPRRALRWLGRGVVVALAACLAYCGWGAYNAHIPTVDDRALLLKEYEPFVSGTRAAVLEEPATLSLDKAAATRLRLDGATALYPVYAAFVQAVYPKGSYPLYDGPVPDRVACTNTVGPMSGSSAGRRTSSLQQPPPRHSRRPQSGRGGSCT